MGFLEKIASKVLPDRIEKLLFDGAAKEKIDYALDFVDGAKDFEPEVDALAVALKNLSTKIKEKAIASKPEWDDAPAIWFDQAIDKFIGLLKGYNKLFD